MGKSNNAKQVNIGNDFEGNLIQGDGNRATIIKNEIDSEEISQGLQGVREAIHENSKQAQWERFNDTDREWSREIQETVFVAFVSAIAIGAFWNIAFPWNAETVLFFVIGTTIVFNILRLTHFGVRHTIRVVMALGTAYTALLKFTTFIYTWMSINQFVGTALTSILGAGIGLVTGFILLFWRPLGD